MARREIISSVNGKPIGRGTVVRWIMDSALPTDPIGIVTHVAISAGPTSDNVTVAFPSFSGPGAIALRGTTSHKPRRCIEEIFNESVLEPIGETSNVPECSSDGHWSRFGGDRRHSARVARVEAMVARHPTTSPHRLVQRDKKLSGDLPRGRYRTAPDAPCPVCGLYGCHQIAHGRGQGRS